MTNKLLSLANKLEKKLLIAQDSGLFPNDDDDSNKFETRLLMQSIKTVDKGLRTTHDRVVQIEDWFDAQFDKAKPHLTAPTDKYLINKYNVLSADKTGALVVLRDWIFDNYDFTQHCLLKMNDFIINKQNTITVEDFIAKVAVSKKDMPYNNYIELHNHFNGLLVTANKRCAELTSKCTQLLELLNERFHNQ